MIPLNYEYIYQQEKLGKVISWLENKNVFLLDTETDGLSPFKNKVLLLQLGDEYQQWIIDCRSVNIQPLKPIIQDPKKTKVGQNIKYDLKFLGWEYGWKAITNVVDTMINEQIIRCGIQIGGASMEALCKRYLDLQIDKSDELRKSFWTTGVGEFSKEQLDYAGGDVVYPMYIARKQKALIKERGLTATIILENKVVPVLAKMELAGMGIDKQAWDKLSEEALVKKIEMERKLNKIFGVKSEEQGTIFGGVDIITAINYNSSKQVVKALEKNGYVLKDTNKNTIALAAIQGKLPIDLAQTILLYRKYFTRVTRYGVEFLEALEATTGRIHSDFTQCKTTSGRLSSGEDDESDSDKVNLQNIPRDSEYRECFIPKPGYKYIIYDYQAIEPRILGELSHDPTYLHAFDNDLDLYGEVGTKILGEEVSKKKGRPVELRDKTKITILGNSYGTGKDKFYRKMLVDMNLSKGILNTTINHIAREDSDMMWTKFFEVCPEIKETLNALSEIADPHKSKRRVWDEIAAEEPDEIVTEKIIKKFGNFLDRYYKNKDEVIRKLLPKKGYVTYSETLGGRKRFFKVYHKTYWTEGRNHPIQGCIPSDTKVLTPDGWKKIGEISEEIVVWTGEEWSKANKVVSIPAKKLRLHLSDGRTFDCDNNHKLLINEQVWPEWCSVLEILGKALVRDTAINWGKSIGQVEDWYWVGRLIGDGWVSSRGWGIAFGPGKDQEFAKKFTKFLDKHINDIKGLTNSLTGYNFETNHYGICKIYGYTQNAVKFWNSLGIITGKKSREKRIANIVFELDYDRRKSFFDGYYGADGSEKGNRKGGFEEYIRITSVNKELLQDTLRLIQTLGMTGKIGNPITNNTGAIWYELRIHSTPQKLFVEKIEEVGFEQMYTLSVLNDKHAYSTEGLISKNTAADILKTAMYEVDKEISVKGHDAQIVNQVHDEVIVEVREDQAEEVNIYVKRILEESEAKFLKRVPPKVEGGIFDKWQK